MGLRVPLGGAAASLVGVKGLWSLCGMVYASRQAHICRAMLEAIAFQTGDVVGAMEKDLQAARCSHCQTSSNPIQVG